MLDDDLEAQHAYFEQKKRNEIANRVNLVDRSGQKDAMSEETRNVEHDTFDEVSILETLLSDVVHIDVDSTANCKNYSLSDDMLSDGFPKAFKCSVDKSKGPLDKAKVSLFKAAQLKKKQGNCASIHTQERDKIRGEDTVSNNEEELVTEDEVAAAKREADKMFNNMSDEEKLSAQR